MIDLGKGHPSTSLLSTKEFAAASAYVYSQLASDNAEQYTDDDRHPLQYGTDAGPRKVRVTISKWFSRMYNRPAADPDLLAITCGASFGLANTCLQFTDPVYTRRIFMVTPAYFLAARIFQDAGFTSKMYAIDEEGGDGLDVAQLERVLEKDAQEGSIWSRETKMDGKRFKYLLYCVPTFSNPSGLTTSLRKRHKLLYLARKYDMLLITDEVYDFLDYTAQDTTSEKRVPIPRLVDLDLDTLKPGYRGNTVSNMSFSKYLGPGLRIGTVQTPSQALTDQWSAGGANHSGGMMAQHTSYVIDRMLREGDLDFVLERLNKTYGDRGTVLRDCISQHFPIGTRISGGEGGYFIWVELPPASCTKKSAVELLEIARTKYGVHALSGSAFEVLNHERGWGQRYIRLSLSFSDTASCRSGIELLGQALRENQ